MASYEEFDRKIVTAPVAAHVRQTRPYRDHWLAFVLRYRH